MTSAVVAPAPQTTALPHHLSVASVPSSHVYVRHLAPEAPGSVSRLPDPDPSAPERSTQQAWWPPVMLDPAWIDAHDLDVFHLQFGFDPFAPDALAEVLDAVRAKGAPSVYTVHDLRNPHHEDRTLHDRQLDVLVPGVDAVVTLTTGAADEIRARWGVEALVVPHPHVVDLATMRLPRPRRSGEFRVGLHVKSLRASMDPIRLLPALLRAVRSVPGGVLQVNGHRDVLDPAGRRYAPELVEALREAVSGGAVEVHVHDFLSDEDLWRYLAGIDVSVLPYRFGTHSGWLEACRDLGTTVVAPSCGYYADQAPVLTYLHDEAAYDDRSLEEAVLRARHLPGLGATSVDERRLQRAGVAQAHERLYRSLR